MKRYNVVIDRQHAAYGDDLHATVAEAVLLHLSAGGEVGSSEAIDIVTDPDDWLGNSTQRTYIHIARDRWSVVHPELSGPTPRPLIIQPPDEPVDDEPVDDEPIVEAEVHADVVQLLRDMLERAERGDVVAVAVAGVTATGGATSAYRSGDRFFALLGSVTFLQARMISEGDP